MSAEGMAAPEHADLIAQSRSGMMREETVIPTPNSVDLVRTAHGDYLQRFDLRSPHIAELFQENTKLTPYATLAVPAGHDEVSATRSWYFSTSYRIADKDIEPGQEHFIRLPHAMLPAPLGKLLTPFGPGGGLAPLLYGVDLYLLHDSRLMRVVPTADYLWIDRRLTKTEEQTIRSSLLRAPAEALAQSRALLFRVGVPWRSRMYSGPRGYRHMLFEAGHLLGQLGFGATQLKLQPLVCLDFYDSRVDGALLRDGTERTTLAVIALQGEAL
jgi:hypothetical protein